jgi:multimeric flavodoxin WrbA
MLIKVLSFSQNKSKDINNSTQIGIAIKNITSKKVETITIKDYNITSCELCGKCVNAHNCVLDTEYRRLIEKIGNPDILFFVVPYYSPYPSKLMIFLEKLNEIFYSGWIKDNSYLHHLQKTKTGLIVHGGIVHNQKVISHYKKNLSIPLSFTLKSLGFKLIEDDNKFKDGFALALEDESSMTYSNDVFPVVKHNDKYLESMLKDYVNLVINA